MKTKEGAIKKAYGLFYEPNNDLINKKNGCVTKYIARKFQEKGLMMDECSVNKGYYLPLSISELNTNNGWIRVETESDLPKDTEENLIYNAITTTGKMIVVYYNRVLRKICKYGTKKEVFGITHYQPIFKPNPPIY